MDATYILWIALTIGGIVGGILTAINKIRFVSKKDCEKEQSGCQTNICNKVDAVKTTVNDLKDVVEKNAQESQKRREADKQELTSHLIGISKFIGTVEQYMKIKNGIK